MSRGIFLIIVGVVALGMGLVGILTGELDTRYGPWEGNEARIFGIIFMALGIGSVIRGAKWLADERRDNYY